MKTLPLLLLLVSALASCSSMENIDRSLTSSPLLLFSEDGQDNVAPLTGIRGSGPSSVGGCAVCAH